jgi:proteasome lid subunit RPN8/RPN11
MGTGTAGTAGTAEVVHEGPASVVHEGQLSESLLERSDKALKWPPGQAAKTDPWLLQEIVFHHDQKLAGEIRKALLARKVKDHVHAVTTAPGTTGPKVPIEKEESCGCAPQAVVVRDESTNACLAEAAKLGPIRTTRKVYELVRSITEVSDQELFIVVPLDARYQLRGGVITVHKGNRASVEVSTAEVLRAVVLSGASNYVAVHCHPSGKCSPSKADHALTKHLERATKVTFGEEVVMLDHVVVGRREFYSIREEKLYRVK